MSLRLWVDDLRDPAARDEKTDKLLFLEANEDPKDWTWVKTITEAIRLLRGWDVEAISLDHDISHTIDMQFGLVRPLECPETYAAVAYFIAEMHRDDRPTEVVIHTANPAGADIMLDCLKGKVLKLRRRHL
jgi:NAD+-processing family protein with receiver domain